jgi:hypothetical protein
MDTMKSSPEIPYQEPDVEAMVPGLTGMLRLIKDAFPELSDVAIATIFGLPQPDRRPHTERSGERERD